MFFREHYRLLFVPHRYFFFLSVANFCLSSGIFKVRISKSFLSLSFVGPMAVSSNCVFGPHFSFSFSFIVCSHRFFLCLFGHSNSFLVVLAETGKNSMQTHTDELKSKSVALKASLKSVTVRCLWFFRESRCRRPGHNAANAKAFISGPKAQSPVLHHSAIDSDLTDLLKWKPSRFYL